MGRVTATLSNQPPPPDASEDTRAQFLRSGIAMGFQTAPGTVDNGWVTPPPVTLSDGTRLRLFKDGQGLHAWYNAIEGAQRSVFLESYIFAGDATGRAFLDLLGRKAREGVRVYVIYDSFGSSDTPRELFEMLRQAGGNVQEFHPMAPWRCNFSWRPGNRDHRKLLIIDGQAAGLGGLNIGDGYGGVWLPGRNTLDDDPWRDCGIGLEGPAVSALSAAFLRTWLYLTRGGRFNRAFLSHNLDGQLGPVGVLAAVPSLDSRLSAFLQRLLHTARQSIDLTCAYFAPANNLVDEFRAAARRGVRVRLMLPSRTDKDIMLIAARSFYEPLMAAGVEVYERQYARLHAKTLCIDGELSLLGSTNFDYRSIDYNCELAAVIRSREFGAQMRELFEYDIGFSKAISPADWRHRPIRDRITQWAVNRSRYML